MLMILETFMFFTKVDMIEKMYIRNRDLDFQVISNLQHNRLLVHINNEIRDKSEVTCDIKNHIGLKYVGRSCKLYFANIKNISYFSMNNEDFINICRQIKFYNIIGKL